MATDQFNVRLRWGLDRQVRVKAAELGVKPRDIIEDALEMAGFRKITETGDAGPNQLRLSMPERVDIAPTGGRPDQPAATGRKTDAAHRDDDLTDHRAESARKGQDGAGEASESDDQRAAEARTPRRKRRKDRADTAGEARKSGEAGGGVPRRDASASRGGDDPVGQSRGCPDCGGNLVPTPEGGDGTNRICEECGWRG